MILAIPTATGFFIPCILDESARWLISKKRINEADTVLHKIANQNGNRFQGIDHFTIDFTHFVFFFNFIISLFIKKIVVDQLKDLHTIR